jgi:glyoxylase-like metal-dependent hydrolase (beta-lactamase superfamily II)
MPFPMQLRRRSMTKPALAICCLMFALAAHAQEAANPFTSEEVSPGIHVIYGAGEKFVGGNVSVMVGEEHVVLIDDAMVPTAPALISAVEAIADRPIDFVINTHYHGDHTGGNAQLAKDGTLVVAHDNLRKRLLGDHVLRDANVPRQRQDCESISFTARAHGR